MILNKKGILSCFVAFTLSAQTPEWFLKPSLDQTQLYGFGAGKNPAEAKQNAIVDLANSLQASIQTSFEKQTKRLGADLTSSALQRINIQTKGLNLFNAETSKAECDGNRCYAQIQIARSKLIDQLEQEIKENIKEINNDSPFVYPYKKEVVYPKMLQNYILYKALGGSQLEIPQDIGKKPTFNLTFQYDEEFSKSFKDVLEKTIQDYITQFGKISAQSDWKILINISKEEQSILLNVSAKHNDEIIHNASVSDVKKESTSITFFVKRLGVQAYKKIQKWGIPEK